MSNKLERIDLQKAGREAVLVVSSDFSDSWVVFQFLQGTFGRTFMSYFDSIVFLVFGQLLLRLSQFFFASSTKCTRRFSFHFFRIGRLHCFHAFFQFALRNPRKKHNICQKNGTNTSPRALFAALTQQVSIHPEGTEWPRSSPRHCRRWHSADR